MSSCLVFYDDITNLMASWERTVTATRNGTGTIGNNGSWSLSLSQTSVNISKWSYIFHLVPVPVLVPLMCSVNIPLKSVKHIDGKDCPLYKSARQINCKDSMVLVQLLVLIVTIFYASQIMKYFTAETVSVTTLPLSLLGTHHFSNTGQIN